MNSKQVLYVLCILVITSKAAAKLDKQRISSNYNSLPAELKDKHHGVKMGVPHKGCDDAKSRLEVDYDGSPLKYTCLDNRHKYKVRHDLKPELSCDKIPKGYKPYHTCMDVKLVYNSTIPTYGDHRPLWPKYGEYLFVPVQRWLHNVEHGAVILLYHPCADPAEVRQLKEVVRSCLRRHLITPYDLLPPERPLALVAWGCRLLMSSVDQDEVVQFIKSRALWGPEWAVTRDGQFNTFLLTHAEAVEGSDVADTHLCPHYKPAHQHDSAH